MCGRASLAVSVEALESGFDVTATQAVADYVPKYNIDPSDGLVTITNEDSKVADVCEWGFIPEWADDPADTPTPINARAETVAESNMFRSAFQNRRCLVIADGFYEWKGERGHKQPYRITRADQAPFAFAGIWSQWQPTETTSPRETVAIVTTEANDRMREIHDRMPVILEPTELDTWLTGDVMNAQNLLDPYPSDGISAYPVSKRVNNPEFESPDLFEEIDIGEQVGLDEFGS